MRLCLLSEIPRTRHVAKTRYCGGSGAAAPESGVRGGSPGGVQGAEPLAGLNCFIKNASEKLFREKYLKSDKAENPKTEHCDTRVDCENMCSDEHYICENRSSVNGSQRRERHLFGQQWSKGEN